MLFAWALVEKNENRLNHIVNEKILNKHRYVVFFEGPCTLKGKCWNLFANERVDEILFLAKFVFTVYIYLSLFFFSARNQERKAISGAFGQLRNYENATKEAETN